MHWLIWLLIFIVIIFLILKIVKTIMKAVMVITSLTVIILIVIGAILIVDISAFNRNFRYSSKLILLEDEGRMIAGATVNGGAVSVPSQDLESYSEKIRQENYGEVLGRNYKLVIFNMETIDQLEFKEVVINQTSIKKSEVPTILRSEAPIKFDVFGELVKKISSDQFFIFQQYKRGNLMAYPETPVFRLVGLIPSVFINSIVQRGIEETTTGFNQSQS